MADIKIEVSGPVNVTIGPTLEDVAAVKDTVVRFARGKTNDTLKWLHHVGILP